MKATWNNIPVGSVFRWFAGGMQFEKLTEREYRSIATGLVWIVGDRPHDAIVRDRALLEVVSLPGNSPAAATAPCGSCGKECGR